MITSLVRTELVKATWRARSLTISIGLVGLPSLIAFALHARERAGRRAGEGLVALARTSGLVMPAAALAVMASFLLIVVAGMIVGDAVSGDAASGNLRYVLIRPVPRGRLLLAKSLVSTMLVWATVLLVALAALGAGVALFGWHPVTVPSTSAASASPLFVVLSTGTLLARTAFAALYVAVGFSALIAMGMMFSVMTDTPSGAIGATIGVYIVSEILDGITDLGSIRYGLPTHYMSAWQDVFTNNHFSRDLVAGVVVQVIYVVMFGAAALWWFKRKDITA